MYEDYSNWQPPRQTSFTHGLGGESGVQDGLLYISNRDRSRAESQYLDDKASREERRLREGGRQDYLQVKNLRDLANTKANEAATGGRSESMFQNPQSVANWAELNGATGNEVSKYLPHWMQQYNTGEKWGGFQAGAAPLGEEGGGGDLPSGIRESSYLTNNGQHELISNKAGGQLQRYSQDGTGAIRTAGMVNSPYSQMGGERYRAAQSTAGGYAGLPTSQQPPPMAQQMGSSIPNIQRYGWDSTSGVEQDAFPTPFQMRGDYDSGRFENVTEDSYDPAPAQDWMDTRKGPSSWSERHTSQLDGAPVDLGGMEPMSDELPPPVKLDGADEWAGEDESDPLKTNDQIKNSINQRADSKMTGDPAKDQEAELERQATVKALDDYSKRGFLPGYRPEDGSRKPSDVSVYGNKRESGMVRRVGEPMVDAGSSIVSGAKQIAGRAKDAVKQVFDFDGTQLNEDPRFSDVRTNVRPDGRMSREEAMSNGQLLSPQEQEAVDRFKMEQILNQVDQHMKSSALAPQENPRIAMGGRRDFDEDFQDRSGRHEFGPMEAGQIDAQMTGAKKSPRMDNDKRQLPMRPPTHKEVLAMYLQAALGGGIG